MSFPGSSEAQKPQAKYKTTRVVPEVQETITQVNAGRCDLTEKTVPICKSHKIIWKQIL